MSNISFSLTEQVIINPVLRRLAAPLNTPENPLTIPGRISHFFESEVATRIIAITTSFFAAIDFIAHIGSGIVKGAHLGLRKLGAHSLSPAQTGDETTHHFKQSAKFLGITLIGSIAASVWPGVLKHFKARPFIPGTAYGGWKSTSDTVQNLWNKTNNKNAFEELWKKASISDKQMFVRLLDQDNSKNGKEIRSKLVDTIYRAITHPSNQWPKQKGTEVFYHATSRDGLEGILKSGKIEVRHEKAYRGAFVSTQPETGFGKYVLVFNRTIERLSHLNHGFSVENAYWAGFSHDIPVNKTTLIGVLIYNGYYNEASELADSCKAWARREITVNNLSQHHNISGDKVIPKEWPGGDANAGAIQQTMKIRVMQQQAVKVKLAVPAQSHRVQQGSQRVMLAC